MDIITLIKNTIDIPAWLIAAQSVIQTASGIITPVGAMVLLILRCIIAYKEIKKKSEASEDKEN